METMAATNTQVLVILGTAFGVMFATLTTLMFTSMRLQHRDNIKTRGLITQWTEKFQTQLEQATKTFQTQLEQATEKNRKLIKQETKKLTTEFDKRASVAEGKLDKVVTSLSDARERLARIEGHLRIELPSKTDPESNGDTSEAA